VRRLLLILAALLAVAPAARAASPPPISAPEAIVVEATSGDVAYSKDPDTPRPMASTTKLMTALLTLEHGGLGDTVTAPRYHGLPTESVIGLIKGEQLSEADLLRALLMYSANDGAVALAEHVAGSVPSFVRMMNRRAQQLHLDHTSYANPIGHDEAGEYSTARDLATLTRRLREFRFFRHTVNTPTYTIDSSLRSRTLVNRNTLLFKYGWVDGVKTGHTTEAGDVLVASGSKRGVHLISVVMGEPSKTLRDDDSVKLLNYGFTLYKLRRAVVSGERIGSVAVKYRPGAELPVVASRTVRHVVRRGEDFTLDVQLPNHVRGPIGIGDRVGKVVVKLRGQPVGEAPLAADLDIPKASAARRLQNLITQPWMLLVLGAVIILVTLVMQRRTPPRREATT
jgi:D-alanyl-D-alanine carboxypeptidase (penicillin-binding protein 5/6)